MSFSVGPDRDFNRKDESTFHPGRTVADVLNDSDQSSGTVLDFFICGGRPHPAQDSEGLQKQVPLTVVTPDDEVEPPIDDLFSKHPNGKQSRQAVDVATHLSMEHHASKQTSTKSSLWAFEHRWPHTRDRAEGRNHRLPSK